MSALAIIACVLGGTSFGVGAYLWGSRRLRDKRREKGLASQGAGKAASKYQGKDVNTLAIRYASNLTRKLFIGATEPLVPSVRAKRAGKTRSGKRYLEQAQAAGCKDEISVSGFCEAQVRLAAMFCMAGALMGALLSTELAVVLGVAAAVFGYTMLPRAVRRLKRDRGACAAHYLSEMLEVVSLGLRSGLTFDRSFALYGSYFDNEFANECARAYRKWSIGLSTREEALHKLEESFDCDQLSRIVDTVLRSLRFGSSMTDLLEEAAAQSRAAYRADLEERVAKAPVKMMAPTGALILPAMLLLVVGPVLLDLANGL